MQLLAPQQAPYEYEDWLKQPFHIRAKWVCQAWAIQGYGAPSAVYLFYILKIIFYIWMWTWFASFSDSLGSMSDIGSWWLKPEALLKAIAWSMLFEGMGFGAGSGPLTARYNPPMGGFLYFLRPKTIKVPFIPGMPFFGGDSRRWIDCLLYLIYLLLLIRLLIAPAVTPALIWPPAMLLLILGLSDRAQFLASRPEHYLIALVCFAFPTSTLPALKWVWFAIWFWAATSKLNHHFPSVISVMVSNSAVIRLESVRKRLFRNYPEDLRASKFAKNAAHFGTVTEYIFPTLLMFGTLLGGDLAGWGPPAAVIGLIIMVSFHTFITSNRNSLVCHLASLRASTSTSLKSSVTKLGRSTLVFVFEQQNLQVHHLNPANLSPNERAGIKGFAIKLFCVDIAENSFLPVVGLMHT